MPNIAAVMSSTRHLPKQEDENDKKCNCRTTADCPLDGECLQSAVVYEATIDAGTTTITQYKYIGLTEGTFKTRFNAHASSFRHEKHRNSTELSKKIWELKEDNTPYKLTWKVLQHGHPYRGGMRSCDLCLTEKLLILRSKHEHLLNRRREILNKCRHTNKFMLKKVF